MLSPNSVVADVGADNFGDRHTIRGRVVSEGFQRIERTEPNCSIRRAELLNRSRISIRREE